MADSQTIIQMPQAKQKRFWVEEADSSEEVQLLQSSFDIRTSSL